MGSRFVKKLAAAFSASALSAASACAAHYIVSSGDTLSGIAHRFIPGRVWGEHGSAKKLLKLNPHLQDNPDFILPGQSIELPGSSTLAQESTASDRAPAGNDTHTLSPMADGDPGKDAFGIFSIESEFFSTRIAATERSSGTAARLLTKSSWSETFTYAQHWSDSFQTSVYFGFQSLDINPPSTGASLSDGSPTLHQLGFTAEWRLSQGWRLGADLGTNQEPFLVGISPSGIEMDLLSVPRLRIFSSVEFYQSGPFSLGAQGGLGISAPGSTDTYRSRWNPDYEAAVYLQQRAFSWLKLESGATVDYEIQNTNIVDQSKADVGVYLKLSFPLGGSFR
jgi:hypothetical protein